MFVSNYFSARYFTPYFWPTREESSGETTITNNDAVIDTISDIIRRRGVTSSGYNNTRFFELSGSSIIEPTAFEPDANTCRQPYYYNSVNNRLYKKVTKNGRSFWIGIVK